MKAGSRTVPHFAHLPKSTCTNASGEGSYHEQGKVQLYEWFTRQGYQVQLEAYLPALRQRPDLLLTIGNRQIAIEYQCCRISQEIMMDRTKGYKAHGIVPLWIMGGNRFKQRQPKVLSLTSFEQLFFHQFHNTFPPTLYFYCPQSRQFAIFHTPYQLSATQMVGQLTFVPLQQLTFPKLFQLNKPLSPTFLQTFWIHHKQRFRANPHAVIKNNGTYSFYQYLYVRGYHASLLPTCVHLPLEGVWKNGVTPYMWQAKWLIEDVIPLKKMGIVKVEDENESFLYPLIQNAPPLLTSYANLLCKLGMLTKVGPSHYRKEQEIIVPQTVHEALRQDEEMIRYVTKHLL